MKILFYPEVPHEPYIVYKICRALNYQMTKDINDDFSLAVSWSDTTIRPSLPVLEEVAKRAPVINLACNNISKSLVDEVFSEVFGYGTMLDPLAYKGLAVQKSDENATHDGEIISCPIPQMGEGLIYQKLIDNQADDGLVLDLRVPIFGGEIPLVYLKYREIEDRFGNENRFVRVVSPSEAFSEEEQRKIISCCQEMGFELGELDVLRDNKEQRIYIIDANNTPYGPPNHTPPQEAEAAILTMAHTFKRVFLRG